MHGIFQQSQQRQLHSLSAADAAHTGLPRSACVPTWVRPRLFAGGDGYLRQENFYPLNSPLSLLGQASQHFWLVIDHDVYQRFTFVSHTMPRASLLTAQC